MPEFFVCSLPQNWLACHLLDFYIGKVRHKAGQHRGKFIPALLIDGGAEFVGDAAQPVPFLTKVFRFYIVITFFPGFYGLINCIGDAVQRKDNERRQIFGFSIQVGFLTQSAQRLCNGAAMLVADLARALGVDYSTHLNKKLLLA